MFPKLSEAFDEVDDEEEPFSNVDHGKEDSMFVTVRFNVISVISSI